MVFSVRQNASGSMLISSRCKSPVTWGNVEKGQEPKRFSGTAVRTEPDGFGIVEFHHRMGANTDGVLSTTIGSTVPFEPGHDER